MSPVRRVVALGGGHGLSATLMALRQLGVEPTAIAGTGDDGGSSGRLREHLGVPPPGDLRMALAALADEGLWLRVLQHRFGGSGDVEGHALGNLILVALWEETGDLVTGLDRLGAVLGVRGRVLPNCLEPVVVVADVADADGAVREVRGQARLSAGAGRICGLRLEPPRPRECPEAVNAIDGATHVIIGPGSWFTSVLTHTLVPGMHESLRRTSARKTLIVNAGPQVGESEGYTALAYLRAWHDFAPGLEIDDVIVDAVGASAGGARQVGQAAPAGPDLVEAAAAIGARLHVHDVLARPGLHDPRLLAQALADMLA